MKKTVLILFGGVSSEHDISCRSVVSVLENIDRDKYIPLTVGITKDGRWLQFTGSVAKIMDGSWVDDTENVFPCIISPDRSHHGILLEVDHAWHVESVNVAFPVLHGKNGEDGTVQGLLELAGIPYVGCGVASSANCMDKDIAKILLTVNGIPNARWLTIKKADHPSLADIAGAIEKDIGYPCFVKPARAGSSIGVTKVNTVEDLAEALNVAFSQDDKLLIEECIYGAEVECAVMGNDDPICSEYIGEIAPLRGVYDFEGKYLDNSTAQFIPARLPDEQTQKIRQVAISAYKALGCTGLSRVDFFALEDGNFVLNEINTLPGFTSISMFPKLFISTGVEYSKLIDSLIEFAEERGLQ